MKMATKEAAPPAEKPKGEAEVQQKPQEQQQKVAKSIFAAAILEVQIMKAGWQ